MEGEKARRTFRSGEQAEPARGKKLKRNRSNLLGDSNMGKAIANMLQGSLSFNEQRHHRHVESESDEDAAENTRAPIGAKF